MNGGAPRRSMRHRPRTAPGLALLCLAALLTVAAAAGLPSSAAPPSEPGSGLGGPAEGSPPLTATPARPRGTAEPTRGSAPPPAPPEEEEEEEEAAVAEEEEEEEEEEEAAGSGPAGDLCNCSSVGSVAGAPCDGVTGQCPCLEGYTGLRCETCAQGFYPEPSGQRCRPCGCSPPGSRSPHCDDASPIHNSHKLTPECWLKGKKQATAAQRSLRMKKQRHFGL